MNLFQKYGGADFWSDFLNVFYTRIVASELLARHFVDKDIDHIKSMLIGLLEVTLVTEGHYPEDDLKKGHTSMAITSAEFNEWIEIYTGALRDSDISPEDSASILNLINSYRQCIVSKP
ncbi:hypothetical protein SteCoe_27740 [Stentor coeruleus]|uniref:Globin family profile domain-containing protein n=1 Tax=Stentor coeruleus TaxID=5963 RepID=A0A1R2B9X0_9CILI|nr:hypothetical protein SteCoe_27740 [Stentor coeruleus]